MLIRSTWTLKTDRPAVVPRSYCLELVKDLHHRLHLTVGSEKIPSVTFSGLIGEAPRSGHFLSFHPDKFYHLTLCGLETGAAKAIASLELGSALEFLGAKFEIRDREDATSSYEELYDRLVAKEPEPVREFNLQFLTPTALTVDRVRLPLPLPQSLFRSWLERWNHFGPVYLGGDELLGYLTGAIALTHHRIMTRSFILPRGYVRGFIGDVTLQISQRADPLLAQVGNLLVEYAQFAGTGIKTRLGMGHTAINLSNKRRES